ncbi:pol polyprotein [Daphnia sinensis]|uniref:Pol polyprotein n=1 Tax=Daphnia sinensis TaxID=1820382 RepID=A0AAD5PM57_9CRUS|nr:pol polyprotein [Daphnia sinensis]
MMNQLMTIWTTAKGKVVIMSWKIVKGYTLIEEADSQGESAESEDSNSDPETEVVLRAVSPLSENSLARLPFEVVRMKMRANGWSVMRRFLPIMDGVTLKNVITSACTWMIPQETGSCAQESRTTGMILRLNLRQEETLPHLQLPVFVRSVGWFRNYSRKWISRVMPLGAAEILVTHKDRSVKGKAIVMAMSGMELLMGNDFLKQFGSIRINYQAEKPLLTMGDLPLAAISLPAKEESEDTLPKTAFVTVDGLYQFRALPFGLTNAPDDVIVYSATFEQHLERLQSVLDCLAKANLKLKWSKCSFAENTLKVLGHVVTQEGVGPDPEKLEAVKNFPCPAVGHSTANKIKRAQSFLGLCSYYRLKSFNAQKVALTSAPVLAHPNYDLPMEILPDACGVGIAQRIDGVERPVAYASRLLCKSEANYSITEKECLALVWCLTKFRCFLWCCQVKVITDHQALCWLMSKRDLAGLHDNADCLSRNPLQKVEEMEDDRCFIVPAIESEAPDILSPEDDDSVISKQRAHREWNEKISKLQDRKERVNNFQTVADNEETVTAHPTPDDVAVAPPIPSEETPARRPIRNRRPPTRYLTCLVPFLVLLVTVFNPPMVTALILRENTIFKEHVDVAFSESAWTIVTDLDLGPAGAAIAYLQQKILQQHAVAEKWKLQGSRAQKIAAKRIFSKSRTFMKDLESVNEQFTTVKEALNTNPRNRRSLIDGGGSALKWLFGVSTQQDLEAVKCNG